MHRYPQLDSRYYSKKPYSLHDRAVRAGALYAKRQFCLNVTTFVEDHTINWG